MRTSTLILPLFIAFSLLPVVANAQPVEPEPEALAPQKKDKKKDKKKNKKKNKKQDEAQKASKDEIEIKGRVFVRSTLSRDDRESESDEEWLHELSLESARVTVDYKRGKYLRVQIESEVSGDKLRSKDMYVRLRPNEQWTVQAGRFKRPLSAIALSSIWDLPVVERGLLGELTPDSSIPLPFGGRGDGLSVAFEPELAWKPEFTAALFMHTLTDFGLVDVSKVFALDAHLRARVKPTRNVAVGVSGALVAHREQRNLEPDNVSNAPLASVDLEAEFGPVALWLEGFLGESTVFTTPTAAAGTMWAARAIAAVRFERPFAGVRRLEPFVAASLFDPRSSTSGDGGQQVAGGVNLYLSKRIRAQVEAEQTWISDPDLLLRASRFAVYGQLGAVF